MMLNKRFALHLGEWKRLNMSEKQTCRGDVLKNGCDVSINIENSEIPNQQNHGNHAAYNINEQLIGSKTLLQWLPLYFLSFGACGL